MLNTILKTSTILSKNQSLPNTNIDDELVMIDIEKGTYINLNKTGRIIWECIETPMRVETLIVKLADKFRIDPEICSKDIIEYLLKMQEANLISTN